MGLRASIPTRRAAAVLVVVSVTVSLTISRAIAQASERVAIVEAQSTVEGVRWSLPSPASSPIRSRAPRVLLLGDSVMDQQGSAAAFLLRQAGVDARAVGLWGSGLLTVDQYDNGRTKRSGMWFARARTEIARLRPDLVGVYLNHNYWPPFPHDSNGRSITDLWSREGQAMIRHQARAFIALLRSRGSRVFFVAPIPSGPNAIWHAYAPVLHAMHVPVADSASPVADADGSRAGTKPSCDGSRQRVRPQGDLHLTRFGAGRAGTALARYVAARLRVDLYGAAAPGERTVALVPRAGGRGYWLVACDGSVYHFGSAPPLDAARGAVAVHGVVAAAPTPAGDGLWLVTADGTIAALGDAPPLAFTTRPTAPVTSAAAAPDGNGLWATTATGDVLRAGGAPDFGEPARVSAPVVGLAASPDGRGYLLATATGRVYGFGNARVRDRAPFGPSGAPIVGIAPAARGGGYWLTAADGRVFAHGSARFRGNAVWKPSSVSWAAVAPAPGPAVGIAAWPGSDAGYWVVGATGRVVARGDARSYGATNNLALFTQ